MFVLPLILAAGSLSTLTSGAPVSPFSGLLRRAASSHSLQGRAPSDPTSYTVYGGSGEVSDGWPDQSDWFPSLDAMFTANLPVLKDSCTQFGVPNNSDDEIDAIKSGIQSVASSSGVDARFILAILMQESNGCVRAPTTNYGVVNPGLMQSHDGSGSCNDGSVLNPCPPSQITQMIEDGTTGTASGDGLKQCLSKAGATDVSTYYKAARIYNSGSIAASGNLGQGIATHCYSSDIANRLTNWASGPSQCDPSTIGNLDGSSGGSASSSSSSSSPTASSTSTSSTSTSSTSTSSTSTGSTPTFSPPFPPPFSPTFSPTFLPTFLPTPTIGPAAASPTTEGGGIFAGTSVSVATESASLPTTPVVTIATPTASPTASAAATSTGPSVPLGTGTTTSGAAFAPGSPCPTDGEWNCISATTFQQCGSGTWSVVQQVAAGTQCTVGQSSAIKISAAVSRRRRSLGQLSHAHAIKHVRNEVS
ncbi:hypothetical protein M430DRAFT_19925 [Amorphotheca resinae ATCC 22711]|uniref:Carbohydrate-binding module family 50 protein n=1 Tax=Amorphotheca resinae ATCC 22711 TaxID=857342 RepID=A0A2T3B0M7_AMORE|nr:hypothetical protein M430DRAFT_19925 [Amorphotheca resinae ATCC 22711]PSS16958.1 hypothetical protein M430DRAFT_19925 [Amorphotheca resinae ATCC 22711]